MGNFTDVALSTAVHWQVDTSRRVIVSEWHGGRGPTASQSQEKATSLVRPESQNVMIVHVQMKALDSCYSRFG